MNRKRLSSGEDEDRDFMDKKKRGKSATSDGTVASGFMVDLFQHDHSGVTKPKREDAGALSDGNLSPIFSAGRDDSNSEEDDHAREPDAFRQLQSQPVSQKPHTKAKRTAISSGGSEGEADAQWMRSSGSSSKKKQLAAFGDPSLSAFGQAQRLTQHTGEEDSTAPPVHEEVRLSTPVSSSQTFCPICKLNISTVSALDRERHVSDCVELSEVLAKQKETRSTSPVLARLDHSSDSEPVQNKELLPLPPASSAKRKDTFLCELCGKDITEYDLTRRQQHLNKCCDQYQSQSVQKLSQKQGSPVPPTPPVAQAITDSTYVCQICQKEISRCSLKARVSHLKSCAKKHGVQPDSRSSTGNRGPQSKPSAPAPASNAVPSASTADKAVVRSRFFADPPPAPAPSAIPAEPKQKKKSRAPSRRATAREEEQLQVALAISASLNEQRLKKNPSRRDTSAEEEDEEGHSELPAPPRRSAHASDQQSLQRMERLQPTSVTVQTVPTAQRTKRVIDKPADEEEVSCTPALAPSSLAKKYAATKVSGASTLTSAATNSSGGLWQTAASADLSSPSRVYVSGLLANISNSSKNSNGAGLTKEDSPPDAQLQLLNQALRTDGIRPPPPPPPTPARPAQAASSSPPTPVPQIPHPSTGGILEPPATGSVAQRVQHILDSYSAQCADRRKVLEEKQRELKNWYLTEIGRLTLEKDDQLATLREAASAVEVDAAAMQLQLRLRVPPLPAPDPLLRAPPAPSTTVPPSLSVVQTSPALPAETSSGSSLPPSQPNPPPPPPSSVPPVAPVEPPALAIVPAPQPPVVVTRPTAPTSSVTVLSQPRTSAVPPITPPIQKPPVPPKPSAAVVTKSAAVPSAKPPLAPPAKPVAVSKPPPVKPPPPLLQTAPAKAPPPVSVPKPSVPVSAKAPATTAPLLPVPPSTDLVAPSTTVPSLPKPTVIDIVSPPSAAPEPRTAAAKTASDDELCADVPHSPTHPPAPPTLFETDDFDNLPPEEMRKLIQILDGHAPATPLTPAPAPAASSTVDSPGLNDSLLKPMLDNVPLLITPGVASGRAPPVASSKAEADCVLIFTPPVTEDSNQDPESEEPQPPPPKGPAPSMAEAKALIARNPLPLEEWSMEEMSAALEKLGSRPGSRQYMRYKLQHLAGIEPTPSVPFSGSLLPSSSAPLLCHSLSAGTLSLPGTVPKAKVPKDKERACSDVDMDLKITQLIKSSAFYEQILQYERVELTDLQDFLKTNGLKVSKKIISTFCSSKGVVYRNTIKKKKQSSRSENDK